MNRKQLTLILIVGVVVGGLAWQIARRNAASYQSTSASLGQKVLSSFPLNDVAQVVIREGTNELELVRQDNAWKVTQRGGYPANFVTIGDLLRKVWDLKAVQTEEVGPSQFGRLQLLDPGAGTNTATSVEFRDGAGKTLTTLFLGKKQMKQGESSSPMGMGGEGWPVGRWLRASGAKNVALVSEVFNEVAAQPDRWLNKDFFKVEKIKSITVTHSNATNSWKVYRETENGELKLADAQGDEKLDAGKSSPVGTALNYPAFTDVAAAGAKPEDMGLDQPVIAKLETFDGFTYEVKVGRKEGQDNCYLNVRINGVFPTERTPGKDEKPEDKEKLDKEFKDRRDKLEERLKKEKAAETWTYIVAKYTVEPILKDRKDLLVDKKVETAKPAGPAGASAPEEDAGPIVPMAPDAQ